MNDPMTQPMDLTDFERQIRAGVRAYMSAARLDLAPAAVVADVVARPLARPRLSPRNLLLAMAGAGAMVVAAILLLPILRPAVVPPAATPSPTSSPVRPTPSPSPRATATTDAPSPHRTNAPTAAPLVIDPLLPAPSVIPDKELLAGSATVHFTDIRQYQLNLPPVAFSDGIPLWRAIDENTLVLSVSEAGREPSTWLADLSEGQVRGIFPGGQLVDVSADGQELLITTAPHFALSQSWDPMMVRTLYLLDADTARIRAHIEVIDPTHAVFLGDGTIAVTSGSGIGVWDGSSKPVFRSTGLTDGGSRRLMAVGTHVVIASGTFSQIYDPASGATIGSSWVGPLFPLASRDGRQVVAYVDKPGGLFHSQQLESLDATDGSVLLEGATSNFPPASSQTTQTEVWISPSVLVGSFQRFSLDAPIGWSARRREFVLANTLQPLGGATDSYFPADSTLIAGNGVLLVLDGESLTVMTVSETTN